LNGILTTRQVAEKLQVTTATVVTLIHRNKLAAFRVGYRFRIKAEELQRFIDNGQQASHTES
jgi:excisionase family DNA binding protein